jgi:hypothetical protein
VAIGLVFGFFATSLNTLTLWITSALYGGYTASNVLKWLWWRFNGFGYFGGMLAGLLAATIVPMIFPGTISIYLFPLILLIAFAGCMIGVLLSPPDDEEVLKNFYRQTRPWGFWKPIREKVMAEDPGFEPNKDFGRDMFNVIVGIAWQMSQVVMPIYLLLRDVTSLTISFLVFIGSSLLLKRFWYDHIKRIKD